MDKENMLKAMRAQRFKCNNGKVMLTVNLLRIGYVKLTEALCALTDSDGLTEGEFLDSVHFLQGNEYIRLRQISSHTVITELADVNYKQLEAIVTQKKGVRLLAGEISDPSIVFEW